MSIRESILGLRVTFYSILYELPGFPNMYFLAIGTDPWVPACAGRPTDSISFGLVGKTELRRPDYYVSLSDFAFSS